MLRSLAKSPLATARAATFLLLRAAVGTTAVWLAIQVLGHAVQLTSNWPLWPIAALGAVVAEVLIWLYRLERMTVPRRVGLTLAGLRLGLLGLILLMLVQPVLASQWTEKKRKKLVVLADVSASMLIADRQMPPSPKLRLAEAFSFAPARRPYHLQAVAEAMRKLRESATAEVSWMQPLAESPRDAAAGELSTRRKALHAAVAALDKQTAAQVETLEKVVKDTPKLDAESLAALRDAKAVLDAARTRLADYFKWTESDKDAVAGLGERLAPMLEGLKKSATDFGKSAPAVDKAAEKYDELFYTQLAPADRAVVDRLAELSRADLAKAALLHRPPDPADASKTLPSLLDRLNDKYDVVLRSYAADSDTLNLKDAADPTVELIASARKAAANAPATPFSREPQASASAPASAPTSSPVHRPDPGEGNARVQRSEMGSAIRRVVSELGAANIAGIVVLSDGQNTSPAAEIEALARELGGSGVSLASVMVGAEKKPPPDAAIVAVEAPETIFLADKMYVNVECKLDGLDGKDVKVTLKDGEQVKDSQVIRVVGDVFRTRIQLADEPSKPGPHPYSVELQQFDEEVFRGNNSYSLMLSVTEDRAKVLLLESRPRWEFRYLKNLFSGRDKTVDLQYVLFQPDRYEDQPRVPNPQAASVTRAKQDGLEQADLMPASEEEWMKFDVIILGDVPPRELAGETPAASPPASFSRDPQGSASAATPGKIAVMKLLKKFVADRGGTMIFIAGQQAMPFRYAGTPLAEVIPLKLRDATSGPAVAPAPDSAGPRPLTRTGFGFGLTSAGKESPLLRQDVKLERSDEIWKTQPPIYWRSHCTEAAPGAGVLLYAIDPDAPAWLFQKPDEADPAQPASAPNHGGGADPASILARKREDYQRNNALLTVASHGMGKVMALSFDQTWRLRYRTGDTYHHKFWGQVVRWATAGELPVGNAFVKFGTDKVRYEPSARPLARARILRPDYSPVVDEQVAVKVFSIVSRTGPEDEREKLVGRVPMTYLKDSPGMYTAALDALPSGNYRLELDSPQAAAILRETATKPATAANDSSTPDDVASRRTSGPSAVRLSTEISVDPAAPIEQIELSANRQLLTRLATLSHHGAVVTPDEAYALPDRLPSGDFELPHRSELNLWDSWWLLVLFAGAATTEWIIRKRFGLA